MRFVVTNWHLISILISHIISSVEGNLLSSCDVVLKVRQLTNGIVGQTNSLHYSNNQDRLWIYLFTNIGGDPPLCNRSLTSINNGHIHRHLEWINGFCDPLTFFRTRGIFEHSLMTNGGGIFLWHFATIYTLHYLRLAFLSSTVIFNGLSQAVRWNIDLPLEVMGSTFIK